VSSVWEINGAGVWELRATGHNAHHQPANAAPRRRNGGMRALARLAGVALVGMGADTVRLDVAPVQVQELSGTGVFRHANINPLALQSAKSVGVRLELGRDAIGKQIGRRGSVTQDLAKTRSAAPRSPRP
jgi:hypothetical protein